MISVRIFGKYGASNMVQTGINIRETENKLRAQARAFMEKARSVGIRNHNSESILLRLTGHRFDDLSNKIQIQNAKNALDTALLSERKKARLKRYDYDLNRHIALHQASKMLNDIYDKLRTLDQRPLVAADCSIIKNKSR